MCVYTKGFSTILDGGLVTIEKYDTILEDEIHGFIEIKNLNNTLKFYEETAGVKWENTIYKSIRKESLISDVNEIINQVGVKISDNEIEYNKLIKKISEVKILNNIPDKGEMIKIGYPIQNFINNAIDKQY